MATVKPLEHKKNKKEAKMHFTLSMAGLGTFKLPPNDLVMFFFMSSSPKQVAHWHVFKSLQLSSGFH